MKVKSCVLTAISSARPAVAAAAALLAIAVGASPDAAAQSDPEYTLESGGLLRSYYVHTPAGYDGVSPLPVVLGFHGRYGDGLSFRTQSGMNDVADEHGFLIVYPNGTGTTPTSLSWNSGPGSKNYATQNDIDDVGFVGDLLDALADDFNVDSQRVYATGMSNGAAFCHRLGIEMSDRIVAIGTVSGLLAIKEPPPPRPVPVIHFHGTADPLVPYSEVAYTIAWWDRADHCDFTPASTTVESDRTIYDYLPNAGVVGAPVVLYELPGGGHTWPGGVDVTANRGTGALIATVPASELIWQFFSQFTLSEQYVPPSGGGQGTPTVGRRRPRPTHRGIFGGTAQGSQDQTSVKRKRVTGRARARQRTSSRT